ncbi:MAG TPA: outer membrane beta-barrel protein [Chitinophagaceae bacterium]|nr:outer membrane beta-barrel protein [Chitinophagaceae bacterium]
MKNFILPITLLLIAFQSTIAQQKDTDTSRHRKTYSVYKEQSDTIHLPVNVDTVSVGPVTIIKDQEDTSHSKSIAIIIGEDKAKKELKDIEISWFGFDIGVNNFIDKSNYGSSEVNNFVRLGNGKEATEEFFSLRTIKSVNVNIWPVIFRINLIKHILNLKTGIGIVMNNYRYTKDLTYVNELSKTYIKLDDIHFSKNKLFTEYLTIPVLFHINSNPYQNSRAFHFSAGPTFGLLVKSRTKQKSAERGKDKNNDPFNLEKFRIGLRSEIGYGPISLYGAYSFTTIHKYGLKQYPFSIGISLLF